MKKLTLYILEHRTLFWSVMVMMMVTGIVCFVMMPKLEDPTTKVPRANVIVPYPGADAHEVELRVAIPMEQALYALPDVKNINTTCRPGMTMITVDFSEELDSKELEVRNNMLRRRVMDFQSSLPSGTYGPIVRDDISDVFGIMIAITGDDYTYPEKLRYAKKIRNELQQIKGVKRVIISGARDQQVQIVLSRERLAQNGMLPMQLMLALRDLGKPAPAGSLLTDCRRITLDIENAPNTIEEIRNLPITTPGGQVVRLGDMVDDVRLGYADEQTYGYFVNNHEALAICVSMEASAIVPDVGKKVDACVDQLRQQFPVGIDIQTIYDQPKNVSSAVGGFMINLAESVLIVLIVLALFMGWKSGVIIGFGLILTICGSFIVLHAWGTTIQRISLGAFIVAMGMLVDNAVVIMDGIMVDRAKGLSRKDYLTRIGTQTAMPLLGATLIAIIAFVCVYISKGVVAEYAADLFRVLCASLLVSWVMALVQIPVCADQWLGNPTENTSTKTGRIADKVNLAIRNTLETLIAHKYLSLTTAALILLLSIFGFTRLRNVFFPDFEYDQFVVECFWPESTDANHVRDNLMEITQTLQQNPAVKRVSASQGAAPAFYCLVRPMTYGGNCYGELMVDFHDYNSLCEELPKIRKQLRETYPDAYLRFRKYNFSIATSHLIEAEFSGPDPAVLHDLADSAAHIMRSCEYIDPYSVQNNWSTRGKHIAIAYNAENGARSGLSRMDVGNALQAAGSGLYIGRMPADDEQRLICLQVRNDDGSHITDLGNIPVWSMMNIHPDEVSPQVLLMGSIDPLRDRLFRTVPLAAVSDSVSVQFHDDLVMRHNGQRAIEVEADINAANPKATPDKALSAIGSRIENIPLPEGYHFCWRGDRGTTMEIIRQILIKAFLSSFVMLLILLLLFHSWKKIGVMFTCVPFMLCGVVLALFVTNTPFTFMALIGVLGLLGMMLKNTVVLMDEIDHQLSLGVSPYRAVIEATIARTRPVLMASITTIVGVVPLVTDPMYGPMALAIMGGLLVGTMVTLLLLPLTYATFFHIHNDQ